MGPHNLEVYNSKLMYRMLGLEIQIRDSILADMNLGVDSSLSISLHNRLSQTSLKVVGRMSSFKDGVAFKAG